ncbi:MAG: N-acetyltransferase [Gemmatimonadales bacterium]|nr:N-acetyltransferase [Gemmatimonadales bacterium]
MMVDTMHPSDWEAVRRIYAEGMATGKATFDTEVPDWAKWNAGHLPSPRLVAREDANVLGWVALMPVSARVCFRGVAEVSIYIGKEARGKGVGRMLLDAIGPASEAEGLWMLFSSIHADNAPSLALHAGCGFRVIGRREKIAMRDGEWCDTIWMERRSRVVGV